MKVKQNILVDLFKDGQQFEKSTKKVGIDVRGQMVEFTIRPMDFDADAHWQASMMKAQASALNDGRLDVEFHTGDAQVDVVIAHTLELSDISDEDIAESGASSKRDFVKTALGKNALPILFNHIRIFSSIEKDSKADYVAELADAVKN